MPGNEKNKSAPSDAGSSTHLTADKKWFIVLVLRSELLRRVAMVFVIVCFTFSPPQAGASTAWLEKAKLLASDGAVGDRFGLSVSISGDYAIVGAGYDNDIGSESGSAYIFRWDGASWVQQQKLTASDGAAGDRFGCSVSISGDYAIVGAYGYYDCTGSAYIFKRDGANWVQQAKILASDGGFHFLDLFGYSVSISGDYAIVGAAYDDDKGEDSGSAYIFKRDGTNWSQQQKLTASDGAAEDLFGCSVSISGGLAIVGALSDDSYKGSAYIFKRDGTNWSEQTKLLASDGAAYDYFGHSVSISGDYAIVGAYQDDSTGSAYIFKWNGTSWSEQVKLTASDGAANDYFGYSVSISGDYAIVGAYQYNNGGAGKAYIFKWDGTSWSQQAKKTASDGAAGDGFGISVSISGGLAIAGACFDDDNGTNSGSAYIFVPTGTGELTLLAPNGGEKLVAGSTYDITWDTNSVVENVFIEYSANNGGNWTAIDTVVNTGSYPWLVPNINSNQCLVWISDAGYLAAGDVSNNVFRIYICTLAYDLNHDCFVDFHDFSLFASEWLKCGDPADPDCQP